MGNIKKWSTSKKVLVGLGVIILVIFLGIFGIIVIEELDSSVPSFPPPRDTFVFTSVCTSCASVDSCYGYCDARCVEGAYDGSERASGYEAKKNFFTKEIVCTCTCYR